MARLRQFGRHANEGHAQRRARRMRSRHRQRRKSQRELTGVGYGRHANVIAMLRADKLPIPGLKEKKRKAHYGED